MPLACEAVSVRTSVIFYLFSFRCRPAVDRCITSLCSADAGFGRLHPRSSFAVVGDFDGGGRLRQPRGNSSGARAGRRPRLRFCPRLHQDSLPTKPIQNGRLQEGSEHGDPTYSHAGPGCRLMRMIRRKVDLFTPWISAVLTWRRSTT